MNKRELTKDETHAIATKMAKEGLNEIEENSVSNNEEDVQAEERQKDLTWLEDIKRLSGLANTYENSAGAMTEYKVDESTDSDEEVVTEEQSPAQKAAFQKMLDAKKGKKSDEDVEEQVEKASGVRADTKGKVDKSEKKHYHCKLTKDKTTRGVRMVADEGESEADVKARCKRENMGWELKSIRKLVESVEMEGEKKDHDGDGDIDSNDYLAARGNAIKAAIAKKKGDVEEGLAELADLLSLAGLKGKVELDELANKPGQGTKETTTYSVSDVIDQGNDLHAKSKQYADKAKLGDNPMATEEVDVVENKLWKAYQAELAGVKK